MPVFDVASPLLSPSNVTDVLQIFRLIRLKFVQLMKTDSSLITPINQRYQTRLIYRAYRCYAGRYGRMTSNYHGSNFSYSLIVINAKLEEK